jgi:hypothetical protein
MRKYASSGEPTILLYGIIGGNSESGLRKKRFADVLLLACGIAQRMITMLLEQVIGYAVLAKRHTWILIVEDEKRHWT